MLNALEDFLTPLRPTEGDACVILTKRGKRINNSARLNLLMKRLCAEIGFKYDGLHATRHTFASIMLMSKESPLLVKKFLGHSDLTMINKVYAHYLEDKEDCAKINKAFSA